MSELDIFEIIIVTVVGSGGLAFFIKYGSRLAILETKMVDLEEELKQMALLNLDRRVSQIELILSEIRTVVGRLNQMDLIADRLDHLVKFADSSMPRPELELRLAAQETKIDTIKKDIDRLKAVHKIKLDFFKKRAILKKTINRGVLLLNV